jgi:hypothetical protein
VGVDDREVRVEKFDAESIYCELAVRTDGARDADGVSVEASWDENGLYVTLLNTYGARRSVRLVVAPEEPFGTVPGRRGATPGRRSDSFTRDLASPIIPDCAELRNQPQRQPSVR